VTRASAARQLLAAVRFRLPAAAETAVPALVLVSDRDGMVSPSCSRAVARRLGATVRAHPTAGHDLPLDDADWVVGEIAAWQGNVAGAARAPRRDLRGEVSDRS
jgi:pimeloyl-ACP methyl ester carboxylesterase